MEQIHSTPVHSGEVLKDELEEVGLTQSSLLFQPIANRDGWKSPFGPAGQANE